MPNRPVPVLNLDRELDALFQQPLAGFVPARNALATQLKKAGRAEEAAEVRALAKPGVTAWAVNQLYWRARGDLDRFLQASDRVRATEQAALAGRPAARAREAVERRQEALGRAVDRAAALAAESGTPLSASLLERLRTTLDAIGAHGSEAARHANGRLQDDLDPPGFSAFAALAASVPPAGPSRGQPGGERRPAARKEKPFPPLRLVRPPDPRQAEARAALNAAQAQAARAQDAAATAADAERKARAALEQADARVSEATEALAAARRARTEAARVLREREAEARQAAVAANATRSALEKARKEVEEWEGR